MKKFKKLLSIMLAVAMILALAAGCGSNSSNNSNNNTDNGGTEFDFTLPPGGDSDTTNVASTTDYVQTAPAPLVRVAVSDVPTNITPWAGTSTGSKLILLSNVYQALLEGVQRTEDVRLIMCSDLDRAYEDTGRGQRHRLYLYDDIFDSEGNHFTAYDAAFSIESCVAEGAIPAASYIGDVDVIDTYTLDVEILSYNRSQLAASISNVYMVTQAAYEASPDGMASSIVATGPYKMTNWVSGTSVVLERVEDYWGADMGERSDDSLNPWMWHAQNVERAEYTKISEPAQAAIALETDVVDVAWLLTTTEAERFANMDGYEVLTMYNTLTMNTYFNCTEYSPFSDVRMRQAVAYAIDRDAVIEANGGYGLLTNTFGSRLFADYVDDWDNYEYYPYDPEKAKELIAESGFDTSREIVILVANSTKQRTITAEVVQGYLMAVGLNVRVDILDSASFAANRFDPTIQDIRIDQQAFENLANLWDQHLDKNVSGHSALVPDDDRLQELVTTVQSADYHDAEHMTEAHEYIMENCVIYSLYGTCDFDVVNSNLVAAAGGRNNRLYMPIGSLTYYVD